MLKQNICSNGIEMTNTFTYIVLNMTLYAKIVFRCAISRIPPQNGTLRRILAILFSNSDESRITGGAIAFQNGTSQLRLHLGAARFAKISAMKSVTSSHDPIDAELDTVLQKC